jgi:uncharacterized protein with von Willebrand factor type A (vWA) domain
MPVGERHGWTVDTLDVALRRLIDEHEARNRERFSDLARNVTAALAASDKAIDKADRATEKRFESVNEWRTTYADLVSTYLSKSEYEVRHKAIESTTTGISDRVDRLAERVLRIEAANSGRKEGVGTLGTIVLGTALAASAVASLVSLAMDVFVRH